MHHHNDTCISHKNSVAYDPVQSMGVLCIQDPMDKTGMGEAHNFRKACIGITEGLMCTQATLQKP